MNKRKAFSVLVALLLLPGLSQARYLNVNTGRFQTMDTYEGDNEDPLSLHKYLYAQDNPVNGIDPTGLKLYKCSGDASTPALWLVGGQHAWIYDDTTIQAYEMTGDCNAWSDANFGYCWGTINQGTGKAPKDPGVEWVDVPKSAGKEAAVRASVGKYPKKLWKPYVNDCFTFVKTLLTENGLTDPPLGRINYGEAKTRLGILVELDLSTLFSTDLY